MSQVSSIVLPSALSRESIIAHRKARKLSQGALGRLVGLTAGDVSRIELGYRSLTPQEALALASALSLSPLGAAEPAPAPGRRRNPAAAGAPPPQGAERAPGVAAALRSQAAAAEPAAAPAGHPLAPPVADFAGEPDLSSPGLFAELPDFRILESRGQGADARLSQALRYATKVLHTSRVPAPVWREWRAFEKALVVRLKQTAGESVGLSAG